MIFKALTFGCPKISFKFSFRTYSINQIYLKAFQQSRLIENPFKLLRWSLSAKLVNNFLAVDYLPKRTSLKKLDWVLNTTLILSRNVIWHAYRSIAENKIFRLGVSFKCLLFVKRNELAKKYITERYITSNTENFKTYLR